MKEGILVPRPRRSLASPTTVHGTRASLASFQLGACGKLPFPLVTVCASSEAWRRKRVDSVVAVSVVAGIHGGRESRR